MNLRYSNLDMLSHPERTSGILGWWLRECSSHDYNHGSFQSPKRFIWLVKAHCGVFGPLRKRRRINQDFIQLPKIIQGHWDPKQRVGCTWCETQDPKKDKQPKHDGTSGGGIRGTHLKPSVRMKKTQDSSKWLFLGNLILEIESKAPN